MISPKLMALNTIYMIRTPKLLSPATAIPPELPNCVYSVVSLEFVIVAQNSVCPKLSSWYSNPKLLYPWVFPSKLMENSNSFLLVAQSKSFGVPWLLSFCHTPYLMHQGICWLYLQNIYKSSPFFTISSAIALVQVTIVS